MSVTEGFFVRIEAEVARLARTTAEERRMPLRELVEKALRLYINEVTEPEKRAAALHAMEEALLGRLDRRLGQHLERVSGLYAREAFDVAQTLDLVKRVLAHAVRDREMLSTYLSESRAEATRTLKQRVTLPQPGEAADEVLKNTQENLAKWQAYAKQQEQAKTALEQEKKNLEHELRRASKDQERLEDQYRQKADEAERHWARFTWAIQQFEAQRGFSRRPISEFLAQWDQEHRR